MSREKTMIGNPTEENLKKPKSERIGGIDVGGPMGEIYKKAKAPLTAEQLASRQQTVIEAEAQLNKEIQDKIGSLEQTRPATDLQNLRKNAVIIGIPAVTPEKLTEYKRTQDETKMTEKKNKGGFWGRLRRFFGGA